MATPTRNSVQSRIVRLPDDSAASYLSDGTKWGGALGASLAITVSFPDDAAAFTRFYTEPSGLRALTAAEIQATKLALAAISAVADIDFRVVGDTPTSVGDIRIAATSNADAEEAAHAYLPGDSPEAGDIWFSDTNWNADGGQVRLGEFEYATLLHEIGHALGLKHPFEEPNVMPVEFDNYFYSVMSYTASPWSEAGDNYASFYPTTLMFYDILALQELYGRNTAHNAGNTVYSFRQGRTYFETIDDASGVDTIKYDGTNRCLIDLSSGGYSEVGNEIDFSTQSSRATVWVGPDTWLERASGGSGSDELIGTTRANTLSGREGNDSLKADSGNDTLVGGTGRDRMSGGLGGDRFVFSALADTGNGSTSRDIITDFRHNSDTIDLRAMDDAQTFTWRGVQSLRSGSTNDLQYQLVDRSGTSNDVTIIFGDIDQDRASEFQIELKGLVRLSTDDFLL